jgi:hypothetical protein
MSVNDAKTRGRTAASNLKKIDLKITPTGNPSDPYDLRWKKWVIFWVKPPIETDEGCNILLQFKLKDQSGTLGFQTPATAAFGANPAADGCPSPGSDAGGEISFPNSTASSTELSILDVNLAAGDLQFAVFFNDGSKLDPIIKNTGGGTLLSD